MKPGFRAFSALALASCILAVVLCNALKKTCKGTYQQDNSNVPYGKCID